MGLISDNRQFTTPIKPKYALRCRALLAGLKDGIALALNLTGGQVNICQPKILPHLARNRERVQQLPGWIVGVTLEPGTAFVANPSCRE